jgi:Putative auto-transporter adhesin, head GIN domain
MKHTSRLFFLMILIAFTMTSCFQEDPGPQMNDQKSFSVVDFDRLEASEALDITVQQGTIFSITATGDSRNLNDLDIHKNGSSLVMKFSSQHNRQYITYITITMPSLLGFSFSGAVNGKVMGFSQESSRFDISLTGASVAQVEAVTDATYAQLTGASQLRLTGTGTKIDAVVSGASTLSAFDFPVEEVKIVVTGASHAKISPSQKLLVSVSGASGVLYRGSPVIEADVTGASSLGQD